MTCFIFCQVLCLNVFDDERSSTGLVTVLSFLFISEQNFLRNSKYFLFIFSKDHVVS